MKNLFLRVWQWITGRPRTQEPVIVIETPPVVSPPKPVRITRCPVMDKLMFTREQAQQAADRRKKNSSIYLRIYCCEFCNTWHLTHHKRYRW